MQPKSRCPRCGGNQFHVKDQFGDYLSCLQCGRTFDVDAPSASHNFPDPAVEAEVTITRRRQDHYPSYR